jgi:hypothetical protein
MFISLQKLRAEEATIKAIKTTIEAAAKTTIKAAVKAAYKNIL